MIKTLLLVGTGGFMGTVLRYLSQVFLQRLFQTTFPIGTMTVNILGRLIIGIVYALSEKGNLLTPEARLFLAVGFCGGFTTFSAFSYNIVTLAKDSGAIINLIYISGSIILGVLAVYLGIIVTKLFY